MNYKDVERILRPQFVWDNGSNDMFKPKEQRGKDTPQPNKWHTSIKAEGSADFGVTVFIGVCHLLRLPTLSICEELKIGQQEYAKYLQRFKEDINSACDLSWDELLIERKAAWTRNPKKQKSYGKVNRAAKTFVKTQLIQAALRYEGFPELDYSVL